MTENQPDIDDITKEIDDILNDITGDEDTDAASTEDSSPRNRGHFASQSTAEQVLEVLQKDARASYKDIADRVGVSKPTVRKYINQLEEKGIITGYSVDVSPQNLTDTTISVVRIEIEDEDLDETSEKVAEIDEVFSLFTMQNTSGIVAEIRATDFISLSKVVSEKISTLSGVKSTSLTILERQHH
ncbi:Lrp/AsnC family transcriptional regulator [Halobacteriaceae archaeon SHR40]|uniref:Lrp/AsnC family transcriptional regulator n=1 Tax=Halovenus amylolytica TaxID=2500550 RepID=UPI000FE3D993